MTLRALVPVIFVLSCLAGASVAQDGAESPSDDILADPDAEIATLLGPDIATYRTVGDTLGLELTIVEDVALLRWRPRAIDPRILELEVDVRAALGTNPVLPFFETAVLDLEEPAAVTVLIDVGASISGEEVGAYLFHAQSLVMTLPAVVDVTVQPLPGAAEILPFTRDIGEIQAQIQALRKSDAPSATIREALIAGAATAEFGATRKAVYVLTDAAECAENGAWSPHDLADVHADLGVIYNAVLFADTEPSENCLQSLAALVETSGGAFYPIDQKGDHPIQPLSSILGVVGGGEILFNLAGYTRMPFEPQAAPLRIGMQLNGQSAEFALPFALPSMGWIAALRVLTSLYGKFAALSIFILAAVIGLIAFMLGLRAQVVRAWVAPLAGAAEPQPIRRGGLILRDPDAGDIRLRMKGARAVRLWGGVVSVNGADTKDILIEDGDVFELSGGERFRLHIPGRVVG